MPGKISVIVQLELSWTGFIERACQMDLQWDRGIGASACRYRKIRKRIFLNNVREFRLDDKIMKRYSTVDFYYSEKNPEQGLDLIAFCSDVK